MKVQNDKSMFLIPTDKNEVISIVRNCSNTSSEDNDTVSMKLLMEVLQYKVKSYTYICNLLFKMEFFQIE